MEALRSGLMSLVGGEDVECKVKAVLVNVDGVSKEVVLDMSLKANSVVKQLGGQGTILGAYSDIDVVLMMLRNPGKAKANSAKLQPPFHEHSVHGPILLIRMDENATPKDFPLAEYTDYLARDIAPFDPPSSGDEAEAAEDDEDDDVDEDDDEDGDEPYEGESGDDDESDDDGEDEDEDAAVGGGGGGGGGGAAADDGGDDDDDDDDEGDDDEGEGDEEDFEKKVMADIAGRFKELQGREPSAEELQAIMSRIVERAEDATGELKAKFVAEHGREPTEEELDALAMPQEEEEAVPEPAPAPRPSRKGAAKRKATGGSSPAKRAR